MFLISSAKEKLFTTLSRNTADGELLKDESVCFAKCNRMELLTVDTCKVAGIL